MTTIAGVLLRAGDEITNGCAAAGIPRPDVVGDPDTRTRSLVWTPDLTAAQLATATDIVAAAQTGLTISTAEYQALKPKLVEIRAFRTRTLAQWNALAAATREADEIAYLNDLTDVLRALLRDG